MKVFRIIAKNGCRLAVVDESGNEIESSTVPMISNVEEIEDLTKPIEVLTVKNFSAAVDSSRVPKYRASLIKEKKQFLRQKRMKHLEKVDAYVARLVLGDMPATKKAAVKAYRQALLDITDQVVDHDTDETAITFPSESEILS